MNTQLLICCSIKHLIRYSPILPSLYCDGFGKDFNLEHVYPVCKLKKEHIYDFHNIFRTSKQLNAKRSNFKFDDYIRNDKNIFVPRNCDKGIIARSLLYMSFKHNYTPFIDKKLLIKWFIEYEPCKKEINHNNICKMIQGNNNIFISNYSIIKILFKNNNKYEK